MDLARFLMPGTTSAGAGKAERAGQDDRERHDGMREERKGNRGY